jgi:uncharacterized protein (TIGR04562 family)
MMDSVLPRLKTASHPLDYWPVLHGILTGVSIVDVKGLAIADLDQASRFAQEYGFDLSLPSHAKVVARAHQEAITFIEEDLLDEGSPLGVPDAVREPGNLLNLLLWASQPEDPLGDLRQSWSCAVLKVMHCLFQIENDLKLRFFDEIRRQVFKPFEDRIHQEGDRSFLVGEEETLPLTHYKFKRNKDRWSILYKLLYKPANVPSDIYDHLGIRLVLNTRLECLMALRLLWRNALISAATIKPFRSRNTLLNAQEAAHLLTAYREELVHSPDYPSELLHQLDRQLSQPRIEHLQNPYSSLQYQSIQITARKMIHLPGTIIQQQHLEHFSEEELRFSFDFEIQLMDRNSYLRTRKGPASHEAYKKRQREAVKHRLFSSGLYRHLFEHNHRELEDV